MLYGSFTETARKVSAGGTGFINLIRSAVPKNRISFARVDLVHDKVVSDNENQKRIAASVST